MSGDPVGRRSGSAARARACATGCAKPSAITDERERIKALKRENHALRQASKILRKAAACCAMAEVDRGSRT